MRVSAIYHQTDIQQLNELEVVQQAKNDPTKFEPLYRKYHNQIYRYVYHRIDDECLAADITSQVFLKALNNLHRYEYRGVPFASWLYRIAKSEVYQSYRNDKSNKVVNIDLANFSTLMDEMEDETFKDEKIAHIIKQLKTLKEQELAMIEMRFFEKRSFKEIGEILFITENNAKVKCFRIIEKLKKAV